MSVRLSLLLLALAGPALAGEPAAVGEPPAVADPCLEIRSRIAAQTGTLPQPDSALLKEIGLHPECAFSRAEVYRAGFGDRPPAPAGHPRHYRSQRSEHGDDDD